MPRYEIHIRGRVGPQVLEAFGDLSTLVEPVETVLYGDIPDRSALQAILIRIHSLGLDFTEVRRVAGQEPPEADAASG